MPINYSKYPVNWKTEIRPSILTRAGNKCERCGVANYAVGAWDVYDKWRDEAAIHTLNNDAGWALFGCGFPRMRKIILTIAHIENPDPTDCRPENLQALCQRCHNRLDAPMRGRAAARTRRKAKLQKSGQLCFWGSEGNIP
mgnify:CR=1 FL=1